MTLPSPITTNIYRLNHGRRQRFNIDRFLARIFWLAITIFDGLLLLGGVLLFMDVLKI